LAQARTLTPDNPQIPALQKRVAVLNGEIAAYSGRVIGGPGSFSGKSAQYEHLVMNREFAQKQLTIALTSMEQARNDAQRKQLYLERISRPSQPDIAIEPHRLRNVFATLILGMILWGIGTLLLASVREHKD
jgi:capsular polysaccharide transport system permease protein